MEGRSSSCALLKGSFPSYGLACYAIDTRCPVPTQASVLRICYAMSGTDAGYAATRSVESMVLSPTYCRCTAMLWPVLTKRTVLYELLCGCYATAMDVRY
eukprot:2596555-Rhodomonas_salina.3